MKRFLVALLAGLLVGDVQAGADVQVIVNAANPSVTLARDGISALFLKKVKRWENGLPVVPVDQTDSSPVRDAFSREILGRSVAAVASYWQQQIFSGRAVPPVQKSTDAAVIEFVRTNPGAVGYVSGSASTRDVRVLGRSAAF